MTRVSERTLLACIAALLLFTALSFGLTYVSLGAATMPVAMLIAALKASLVLLFFMHLVEASKTIRLVASVVPVFVVLLVGLVFGDVVFRRP
jgi:cytochrome c oxidase subunit IV